MCYCGRKRRPSYKINVLIRKFIKNCGYMKLLSSSPKEEILEIIHRFDNCILITKGTVYIKVGVEIVELVYILGMGEKEFRWPIVTIRLLRRLLNSGVNIKVLMEEDEEPIDIEDFCCFPT